MSHYLQINGQRLIDSLYALGEHGALPGGGVCRLAATAEDKAGRDFVVARMKALCERPVDPDAAEALLQRVLVYAGPDGKRPVVNEQALANVRSLYEGGGRGALMASSRGTAWGLLNSVTEYVDHHRRARSDDHRRDAAWFGQGAQLKQRAWDEAMKLVA